MKVGLNNSIECAKPTASHEPRPLRFIAPTSRPGVHNGSAYHRLVGRLTAPLFIAGALLAFAGLLAAPAQAQQSVPHDWALNPSGLSSGDSFRLLFLSSTKRNATPTDIATYNTFVQDRAAAGHSAIQTYSSAFRVVGCTGDDDARDNTSTTGGMGVPIYWLNGPKIADDYADFYDGTWDNRTNSDDRDETGTNSLDTAQSANYVYTGCRNNGREKRDSGVSRALGTAQVQIGRLDDFPFDSSTRVANTSLRPFYGLSPVFTIASRPNTAATGQPTIAGTAQVGQTLTASTSGIADDNGLTTPGWTYQWILVDGGTETNIPGARSSTYTLGAATAGKQVKVKVSFTDNDSYSEELTSDAYPSAGTITESEQKFNTRTSSVPEPEIILTARFRDVPAGHDGSTAFTLLIAFSERISTTAEQMQQALTVTGGTVTSAREASGLGDRWEITVTPNSDDDVRISLSPTTSCSAAGAICSSNDRRVLSRGIAVSIPRAPLTARFAEVPTGHHGTTAFALQLAFSEPIETTAAALTQALTVANATITSVQPVDDRSDLWQITVTPDSNAAVRLSLPPTTSCDDDNAVCTAGGQKLSAGIAVSIARTPLTAGFEQVPEGHNGIPFTLQLAFSEPIGITATTLEQALTVTGGRMMSTQQVDDRRDLWEIQLQPNDAEVRIALPKTTSCADEGAICTQGGLALQDDAQAHIPFVGYLMPHALDKTSGDEQTGPASTQLAESFVVFAADEEGTALAGVIVTFTVTAGGGMLSANTDADPCTFESSQSSITAITDATGQATTRLTLGSESGTNTVEIAVAGLEPEPFTATATEQAMPHTLAKVCGEDQEGTVGQRLAKPFVVFVSDEDGAAIADVAVTFAVTAGGGTLSATVNTTNADGYARTWLTLGSELGTNTVTATVEGLESVTFTATGQASPLASMFDAFISGSGKLVALPDSPQLAQNAPNPFNSQTVLAYFLPAAGPVRLDVFSLTGQRVAVLRHGQQQAGYHQLRWDGRDDEGRSVASGLYLYRLVTDETVLTRKLTLLR